MLAARFSRTESRRRPRIRGAIFWLVLTAGLGIAGCTWSGTMAPSSLTVPWAWRTHHPWGPRANKARAEGQLAFRFCTRRMAHWAEFGQQYLQEGDVVFRRGHTYALGSRLGSNLIARLCASPFSHNGIVCFEDGKPWIYDMAEEGIRKMPFEAWMLDTARHALAVKRLKPAYRDRIPFILAFCETAYRREVSFDYALKLDNDQFYCTKLVEKAFAFAGVSLSEPVPIRCLPNFCWYRWLTPLTERVTGIRVNEPIYTPGNACFGTYNSPLLDLIYQDEAATKALRHSKPPTCPPRSIPQAR